MIRSGKGAEAAVDMIVAFSQWTFPLLGKLPTFLVAAPKDPIGASLDRIQIIKG